MNFYHSFETDQTEYKIVVAGSEGQKSKALARGLEYVETDNRLLDKKYDEGFVYCKQFEPDAVALVGSDDFITQDYFEWAMDRVEQDKTDLVGLLDFYITDLVDYKIHYWSGYDGDRKGDTIGAGRVFSKSVLDVIDWMPFASPEGYKHMTQDDERAEWKMKRSGAKIDTVNMANIGCRYWAVKTGNEINPKEAFFKHYQTGIVDVTEFSKRLFVEDVDLPFL